MNETHATTHPLPDVLVWMRHAEGEHQKLLERAEALPEESEDPEVNAELAEIERRLEQTSDMNWNLTPVRGRAQATCAGQWIAKHLLTPGPYGLIVPGGMFDGGYTSPANRAEQTTFFALLAAERALGRTAIRLDADGHPIMPIDMRLREINLGIAAGMTKRRYRQLHPDNVARRGVDPLFTAYRDGATIADHMDLVIRSLCTTLGRDAARGSRSALLSTHGRTIRAAALTIRRDHPRDFVRIDREERVNNTTLFIVWRSPDSLGGFNKFAFVAPWIEQEGQIVLNDVPPQFIDFKAPSSRPYTEMSYGLAPELVARLLAERPQA